VLQIKHQNGFVTLARPRAKHPAILVKYARKGVPEKTAGSWTRGEFAEEKGKYGAHVSDSNGEKEEKGP